MWYLLIVAAPGSYLLYELQRPGRSLLFKKLLQKPSPTKEAVVSLQFLTEGMFRV